MTHRRKEFIVYPPKYKPGRDRYRIVKSVKAAKKLSMKMGHGAEVQAHIRVYDKPRTHWKSSFGKYMWEVYSNIAELPEEYKNVPVAETQP